MSIADDAIALKFLCKEFERLYDDQPHLADKILRELQQFPIVSRKDPEKIRKFSYTCNRAMHLAMTHHGESLRTLDSKDMQNTVTSRLDEGLTDKWVAKNAKLAAGRQNRKVLFSDFCEWLEGIDRESMIKESINGKRVLL